MTTLSAELREAIEVLEGWTVYAPDYFKEKHNLRGDLDRLYAALAAHDAQQQEPAQDAKDAARYRWLRDALYIGSMDVGEAYITMKVVGACPTTEQFDDAIDAAMEAKK
jgi:hypothetical protein